MVAPYQVFPTRDGELMMAAATTGSSPRSATWSARPGSSPIRASRTNPDRVANREELVAVLSERLRESDTAEWHERLTAAGVPAAPVADVADVVESPQTEALGIFQPLEHPVIPDLRLPVLPLSFGGERLAPPQRAAARRRALGRDPPRGGLRRRGDRGLGRSGVVRLP